MDSFSKHMITKLGPHIWQLPKWLVTQQGSDLAALEAVIKIVTNSVAEYEGPILGLQAAAKHFGRAPLRIGGDCQLVIGQITGSCQVGADGLRGPYDRANGLTL